MFRRLVSAADQSRSAKTVEVFGWLILVEGIIVLFAPNFAGAILGIAPLSDQAANYFRIARVRRRHALRRQRPPKRRRFCLRLAARSSAGSLCDGDSLVPGHPTGPSRVDFFHSGFRQLSLDSVRLAGRATSQVVKEIGEST